MHCAKAQPCALPYQQESRQQAALLGPLARKPPRSRRQEGAGLEQMAFSSPTLSPQVCSAGNRRKERKALTIVSLSLFWELSSQTLKIQTSSLHGPDPLPRLSLVSLSALQTCKLTKLTMTKKEENKQAKRMTQCSSHPMCGPQLLSPRRASPSYSQ